PILLATVAAYHPLYSLPGAPSLLSVQWPESVAELLRRQIREPLAEAADAEAIPALTPIDDGTSMEVMRQYEENPYPRWTLAAPATSPQATPPRTESAASGAAGSGQEILIAGCGTGRHAVLVAQRWPLARILAIDLSRASLAYARRKARETGLEN